MGNLLDFLEERKDEIWQSKEFLIPDLYYETEWKKAMKVQRTLRISGEMRCTSISVIVPSKWISRLNKLVIKGEYDNPSDYIRDLIRVSMEKEGLMWC